MVQGRQRYEVIVIGGGQAGLTVGYHLARRGIRFAILDAGARVGDVWRRRWDSLKLFTPTHLSTLPGLPFPRAAAPFATKDQMADYLESYAAHFQLPVMTGMKVERLSRRDGLYVVEAGGQELVADQIVVAMAHYQKPRVPAFAGELAEGVVQLHSSAYQGPAQLRAGPVLVVGAGNSGAEIALEAARAGHPVLLAGRDVGHVPFRIQTWIGRVIIARLLLRVFFHRLCTLHTRLGRKVKPLFVSRGGPLIRLKPHDLAAAGVTRAPRVAGVRDGRPVLEDGRQLDVANVVWCTGFGAGMSWIDLPVFDDDGRPRHEAGVVPEQPGLYFVGLGFLFAASSSMIHGVSRDAARIVRAIAARRRDALPAPAARILGRRGPASRADSAA